MREPCATRTIMGADSLTFDVFIITPSVTFSGVAALVLQGRRCSCLRSIPEPIWVPLLSILTPLFSGVRERLILGSLRPRGNVTLLSIGDAGQGRSGGCVHRMRSTGSPSYFCWSGLAPGGTS